MMNHFISLACGLLGYIQRLLSTHIKISIQTENLSETISTGSNLALIVSRESERKSKKIDVIFRLIKYKNKIFMQRRKKLN